MIFLSSESGTKMKKGLILAAAVIAVMSFAAGCTKTGEGIASDVQSTKNTVSDVISKAGGVISEAEDKTESFISDIVSNMR